MVVEEAGPVDPPVQVSDAARPTLAFVVESAHPENPGGDPLVLVKQVLFEYHAASAPARLGKSGQIYKAKRVRSGLNLKQLE